MCFDTTLEHFATHWRGWETVANKIFALRLQGFDLLAALHIVFRSCPLFYSMTGALRPSSSVLCAVSHLHTSIFRDIHQFFSAIALLVSRVWLLESFHTIFLWFHHEYTSDHKGNWKSSLITSTTIAALSIHERNKTKLDARIKYHGLGAHAWTAV